MHDRIGPSVWEQVAREAAGPDGQPCTDWTPDAGDAHCQNCGWGPTIPHRDHAAREMDSAFGSVMDEALARLLYGSGE